MNSRRANCERHSGAEVRAHIAANHPRCPPKVAEAIVARVERRFWNPPVALGEAVGIVADSYVRHELTDYDQLLDVFKLTREEARLIINPEVSAIVRSWRGTD